MRFEDRNATTEGTEDTEGEATDLTDFLVKKGEEVLSGK